MLASLPNCQRAQREKQSPLASAAPASLASRLASERAPPSPPVEGPAFLALPNQIDEFDATALVGETGTLRRTYTKGSVRITVTIARLPMPPPAYESWVMTSRDGFPQATSVVPPAIGNGFYQCSSAATPTCDLLIQLRSGYHIEIRGQRTAQRADVDAIARGLPLASLTPESHLRN
jgi:hypothetical protein